MKRFLFLLFALIYWHTTSAQGCLNVSVILDSDISCFGGSDGTATALTSDGTPPYTYLWDNGETTSTATQLNVGTHAVVVTDALGCSGTGSVIVIDPPFLDVIIFEDNINVCNDICATGLIINVAGGTAPFTYLWSDGSILPNAFDLCPGIYTITVTDGNGCTTTASWDIIGLPPMILTTSSIDETCDGADGSATVTAIDGTPPYAYNWSNGATTPTISNLPAGTYWVEVVDVNGCLATEIVIIESTIDLDITTTDATCDMADGTATITINSGAPSPTYAWNNGQTTATATGLAQGWYSVSIEDQTINCNSHRNVFVDEDISCKVIINGYVLSDDDNRDCVSDASTQPLANRLVRLSDGGQVVASTFSDATGYYEFVVNNGTYELELNLIGADSLLCPSTNPVSINAPTDGLTYTQDFYTSFEDIQDLIIYLSRGPARPGFIQYYNAYYCNNGSDTTSGIVTIMHDSLLVGFNANGTEDSYDAATYTAVWSFTDLAPGECRYIYFNMQVPVSAQLGTLLTSFVSIKPVLNDATPSNNEMTCHQVVTGSYDPNDKQNLVSRDPFGGDILPDVETYHYQIRFQNTGTDTAFTVVVKDELDTDFFDLTTIRPIDASHDYTMEMENNNTLVFFFNNIMLPDSNVNEPASNGFVYFTIDKFPNLPLGTQVSNEAAIYFDFNAPIITNAVVNTLAIPSRSIDHQATVLDFSVFPNPFSEELYVEIELKKKEVISIEMLDVQGRVIKKLLHEKTLTAGQHQLSLENEELSAGVYFLSIQTSNNSLTKRIVRMD